MKWANKGHEFDVIGEKFVNVDKIYIYGCGMRGKELAYKLSYCDCVTAFVDYKAANFPQGLMGKPVYSQQEFLSMNHENAIVIIAMADFVQVKKILIYAGFNEGTDLFDDKTFANVYLYIYYLYRFKKLYFDRMNLEVTNVCSLKCKHCVAYIPFLQHKGHVDYSDLIKDIDTIFNNFDFLNSFDLVGGEPFLYPYLCDVIEYVFKNYSKKINFCRIFTNGVYSALSKETMQTLFERKIIIEWSDYREGIKDEQTVSIINKNIKGFNEHGINVSRRCLSWSDYQHGQKRNELKEDLCTVYNNCYSRCSHATGKILLPCLSSYVIHKDVMKIDEEKFNDFIVLDGESNKHVILESLLGYTESGYTEMCQYCGGSGPINNKIVVPGKQVKIE
ncbi:MAG: 4Fe-4S cluster-binding domain-containing protein [Chitinispirillales bacterium]|jgi:uncharacterized radical SAM superfamily Fe-S cluster-containing enzyme|nr:4Fe-4S cluster-binding domain-containing protein [Chitinispirillales bacterium]